LASFKRFMLTYLAILILSVVIAHFCAQTLRNPYPYGDITPQEAEQLIDTTPSLKIVDIRLNNEYIDSHIPQAINVCACDLNNLLTTLNPNDQILLYDRNGLKSAGTMKFLNQNGYHKTYNLLGGLEAWIAAGYSIIQ
jgi:rhodanese-related sulfurtransferase